MVDTAFREELKKLLGEEKIKLEHELSSIARRDPTAADGWNPAYPIVEDAKGSGHDSLEEQADLTEEYEANVAEEGVLALRLQGVNRALTAIETPEFGRCKTCGKDIPPDRLRANPAAEYDIDHQPRD